MLKRTDELLIKTSHFLLYRFDVSGIHPNSKMPGTFTEVSYHKKSNEILVRLM